MSATAIAAPSPFDSGGRGPILTRWLHDADLLFADSNEGFGGLAGSIEGAVVEEDSWVIFHGLQVIQIVPDEVNSGWYLPNETMESPRTNVWRIEESVWKKSFDLRHLAQHGHFIIEFYDEIVELICRELLFGQGSFDLVKAIELYPQLSYAYLRRAMSMEKLGRTEQAIADYERYISLNGESTEYAKRCVQAIRTKL